MRVKNFPGRKNKKRISALARLPDKDTFANKEERKTLLERIMSQSKAETIKTKKTRVRKEK